nr:MAG TPA: hypothetical protein [Microviridae sp.]
MIAWQEITFFVWGYRIPITESQNLRPDRINQQHHKRKNDTEQEKHSE